MTHPTNVMNNDDGSWVTLLNGLRVQLKYYDTIQRQVLVTVPTLAFEVTHTAAHLCDRSFWSGLSDGDRRVAGQVVRDLVERQLVPLELVEWEHEYPLKYRRK